MPPETGKFLQGRLSFKTLNMRCKRKAILKLGLWGYFSMCSSIFRKKYLKTYDCVNRDFCSNGILHFKKFEYIIWLSDVSIFMSHFFRNFILFSTFVPFDRISMSVWFQFHYVNLPHWSISRLTFNAFTFNRKLKSRFIWWLCHIMALNLNVRILSNEDTRLIEEGIDTWWYIANINLICHSIR